jgi:hypothetical protein
VLASSEFAAVSPESMLPLGEHAVKGLAEPLAVFAPV